MANIKYDKNNYRIHSAENKSLIKKSLEDCGAGRSILIDNEDEIIAGNGVYEQAKSLGIPVKVVETDGNELIAVKRTDLKTADQKRKVLAVMDNTTSDSSEFDIEKLESEFDVSELNEFGIEGIGDIMEGTSTTDEEGGSKSNGNGGNKAEGDSDDDEELETIPDDDTSYGAGENQRIIICYKRSEKEKLEKLLGVELSKILYNIKDLVKAREENNSSEGEE